MAAAIRHMYQKRLGSAKISKIPIIKKLNMSQVFFDIISITSRQIKILAFKA